MRQEKSFVGNFGRLIKIIKFAFFSQCLVCQNLHTLREGDRPFNEIASCVTVWLQIENNRMLIVDNGDDVTIYFTWCFILLTWDT